MQARVASTRLPAKVLKEILGNTVLEHDIERCLRVKNVNGVIIATTVEPEADKIVEICQKFPPEKVKSYRGSVEDVLERYYEAAAKFGCDIIVRITSDCPLLDPSLVCEMIRCFLELREINEGIDYLCNNMPPTFPHGLDVEIFTFRALEHAFKEGKNPHEREHVTPYIRNHPDFFKLKNFPQQEDQSHYRWVLDYPEDYQFIKRVYEELLPTTPNFNRFDVLNLLKIHPEIQSINEQRRQR